MMQSKQSATKQTPQLPPLAITTTGKGQAVWLLHGQVSSHRYWRQVVERLKANYKVIQPDLIGFGESPKPSDITYDVDTHVAAIKAAFDAQKDSTPVILVGHSMGAQIAIRFAALYPALVRELVLSGLPLMPKGREYQHLGQEFPRIKWLLHGPLAHMACTWHGRYESAATRLTTYFAGPSYEAYDRAVLLDTLYHTWRSYNQSMQRVVIGYSFVNDLQSLQLPIRVVIGQLDAISSEVEALLKQLEKANIQLTIIPKAHHNVPLDYPDITVNVITNEALPIM